MTRWTIAGWLAVAGCTGDITGRGATPGPWPMPMGGGGGVMAAPSMPAPAPGGAGGSMPVGGAGGMSLPPNLPPAVEDHEDGGNHLSAEDLRCRGIDQGVTPARLVRLTGAQYGKTIAAVAGSLPQNFNAPFTYVAAADRYTTRAASYTMTDDELVAMLGAAELGASHIVGSLKRDASVCVAGALGGASGFAECVRATIGRVGQTLFRRPLPADEVAMYAKLAIDNQAMTGGKEAALSLALQGMLSAPDFLFRVELGEGPADAQGRRRLGLWELAAAISYTLADAPPDPQLQAAAREGRLANLDEVRAQVTRYVGTPDNGTARFTDFMREYLAWDRVPAKNTVELNHPQLRLVVMPGGEGYFSPVSYGPWDSRATVKRWLTQSGRKNFWKTALTSNEFVIRPFTFQSWDMTRAQYQQETGVDARAQLEGDIVRTFPADKRAGFLSLPTFMMNVSTFNMENLPVQRGRWIRENLLCKHVPELPIGSVPPLPEGNMTLREKLKVHSSGACESCHKFMDPFGLVFEGKDHFGRTLVSDHGKMPDESGAVFDAGAIDGPVVGIPQLARKLASSPEVELCFIRQNLRYLMNRNEQAVDACTLAKAQTAYTSSGGDYAALMISLLTSDSFLYRKGVK